MNKLLKEYIKLLINNILLEAGTTGPASSISAKGATTTMSTRTSTGTGSSESTLGTGSSADKQTDSISNIEDAVKANSATIANNQKAINTAAHKMATQTNNMISSTKKTAEGLNAASDATKDLNKPEQSKEDVQNNIERQSDAFNTAATGVNSTTDELRKTLTTLQGLDGATKSK